MAIYKKALDTYEELKSFLTSVENSVKKIENFTENHNTQITLLLDKRKSELGQIHQLIKDTNWLDDNSDPVVAGMRNYEKLADLCPYITEFMKGFESIQEILGKYKD